MIIINKKERVCDQCSNIIKEEDCLVCINEKRICLQCEINNRKDES